MEYETLLAKLPYQEPFLFVDRLLNLHEEGVEGEYTFRQDSWFYRGHFKDRPVTPGVLLTECCAQIGLACLGVYLYEKSAEEAGHALGFALAEDHMEFLRPVSPGETVRVRAAKVYFRFGKLKVRVSMLTNDEKLICKGTLSGMLIPQKQ